MNWDAIRQEYETTKITLKALAEKHDIKLGTLKSRKSRDSWSRDATKTKKVATIKKDATPELVIKDQSLNDRQSMFCLYYLKYFNATKAYQKAYSCDYNTAHANAYRLMAHDGVKAEIERLKAERQAGVFLDAQAVLQKYIDIAFADITDFTEFGQREFDYIDDDGNKQTSFANYVNFKNHNDVDGTVITEVKQGKDGVSVKLADKMQALNKLTEYTDMLPAHHKRKLEEERIKADTAKVKAETRKLENEGNTSDPPTIHIVDRWGNDD